MDTPGCHVQHINVERLPQIVGTYMWDAVLSDLDLQHICGTHWQDSAKQLHDFR